MKDEALVKLLLSDPDRGLYKLIRKYGGLVYSIIAGRLRSDSFNRLDIEDCAADTFFEFWRGFEKSPCKAEELRARLCVIAKRNSIDRLRLMYSGPDTVSADSEEIAELSGEDSVEGDFERKEERSELIRAVKELGKPDSDIIIRKYYLGQSSKTIAEELGMSVSNVDTRTHRAIMKLRTAMGGNGNE